MPGGGGEFGVHKVEVRSLLNIMLNIMRCNVFTFRLTVFGGKCIHHLLT